jgi:hypothetical protein
VSPDDDGLDEDDFDEDGPDGGDAADGDADHSDELFAAPEDDEYDTIKYHRGLQTLPPAFAHFADLTREWLTQPLSAFAVRFTGGDPRTGAVDPDYFTKRILRVARLNRWVTNSKFKGVGNPGLLATLPGSLVAHFTVAEGEAPRRLGRHTEYPTVAGARAVTRLLAYADDEEALLEAVHPLGKLAVRMLLGTLNDSAELGITVNWLTHEGQYTSLTPERAGQGVETLNIVPKMVTGPRVQVIGQLDRPDHARRRVRLEPLRGGPMLLHYPAHLEERIRQAWTRYVTATIVVEQPENPSLPRAPARVRTLLSIDKVHESDHGLS